MEREEYKEKERDVVTKEDYRYVEEDMTMRQRSLGHSLLHLQLQDEEQNRNQLEETK